MENELKIILRYLVDKNSENQAKKSLTSVSSGGVGSSLVSSIKAANGAMTDMNNNVGEKAIQLAKDWGMEVEDVAKKWSGMSALGGKTEQQILADVAAFRQMDQAAGSAAQAVKNIDKNVAAASKTAGKYGSNMLYGITGFTLAMTGRQIAGVGQSMLAPITQYLKYASENEKTSARWLGAQQKIENSVVSLGRSMAEILLPTIEKIADVAEKAAKFAEENPTLAAILTGGGIALAGTGRVLSFGGNILSAYSSLKMLKLLTAGGLAGSAAAGGGAAISGGISALIASIIAKVTGAASKAIGAIGSTTGAAAGGVLLGSIGYNAIFARNGRPTAGMIAGQGLTAGAYGLGNLIGGQGLASSWGAKIGKLTGVIKELDDASEKAAVSVNATTEAQKYQEQAAEAYEDYQKKETEAAKEYAQERADLVSSYNREAKQAEEDYQRSRASIIRDYLSSERQASVSYYQNRKKLAADYGTDTERAEEDYQRKMRQLAEDHNQRLLDLADERDALGIVREQRAYDKERREAEEEYNIDAGRRREDFAQRITEMASEYATQRAQRLQEFQQRLADEAQQYALTKRRNLEEHRQELTDLKKKYDDERRKRLEAYKDEINDIYAALNQRYKLIKGFTDAELAYIRNAVASVTNGKTASVPSHLSGGYTRAGLAMLHDNEYVLNPSTTAFAERALGGKLNQQNLMAGLSRSTSLNATITVGVADPLKDYKTAMQRIAEDVLGNAMGA